MLLDKFHWRAVLDFTRPAHVVVTLRPMAVQANAEAACLACHRPQLLGLAAPVRRRDGAGDTAHRHRTGVVITMHVALNRGEKGVERLRHHLRWRVGVNTGARLGLPATAQHHAHTEFFGFVKHRSRRIEWHAGPVVILMIGNRGAAGQQQLDDADARGQAQRLFRIKVAAIRHRHCAEPGHQREIDAGRDALDQTLEQMMVGIDPARIDHAAGGVNHALARQGGKPADRRDHTAAHADVAGARRQAHRSAGQPGERMRRTAHHQIVHCTLPRCLSHAQAHYRASRPAPTLRAPPSP